MIGHELHKPPWESVRVSDTKKEADSPPHSSAFSSLLGLGLDFDRYYVHIRALGPSPPESKKTECVQGLGAMHAIPDSRLTGGTTSIPPPLVCAPGNPCLSDWRIYIIKTLEAMGSSITPYYQCARPGRLLAISFGGISVKLTTVCMVGR